jgi:signal transduction histidine kinase
MGVLALLLAGLIVQFVRQQRAREREQARVAQMEKFEALGRLTSGIAHDFANLLNIIATNLQMIALPSTDDASTRNASAVAQRAVARGTHLIERLRAFATRKPLDIKPSDLNAVVRESSELLRQAVTSGTELASDLAGDLSPCLADESELEVALVNLVVNARDAGARRIEVKTYNCTDAAHPPLWRHDRAYEYVCLSVGDDGSGMSEEVRRRALEPFYTTKGDGGTGLGLAQVYAFMQQIGGDVSIDSAVGSGTTVHLLFRRAKRGSDRDGVFGARRVRNPDTPG